MRQSCVVIDFETTGISPGQGARATEVAAVLIEDGRITDQFQSLMNAGVPIPLFIQELTGISNSMIRSAPPNAEVMRNLAGFVGNAPLVAHNAAFDRKFLDAELAAAGLEASGPMACSMRLARRIYPQAPNHRLATLVELAGIETGGAFHRAAYDAEMTARLWLALAKQIRVRYGLQEVSFELMRQLSTAPRGKVDQVLRAAGALDARPSAYS